MHPFLSLGRLQLPVFGLFAAAGLVAAMALGLRTAPMAHIDRDAFWDTAILAVFSAFLLSRALLIAQDLRNFFAYPLLVLELPSLTSGGLLLTALATAAYLRHRHLPWLGTLDAVAPCVALLASFVSFGLVADGTREGMPVASPAIASAFGRVHPVELYAAIAWLALCLLLLAILRRDARPGQTAASALLLGGLNVFLLDFVHLPAQLYGSQWLDRIQWRALLFLAAGCLMLLALTGAGQDPNPPHSPEGKEGAADAL